jgi:hypothetical protein
MMLLESSFYTKSWSAELKNIKILKLVDRIISYVPGKCTTVIVVNRAEMGRSMTVRKFLSFSKSMYGAIEEKGLQIPKKAMLMPSNRSKNPITKDISRQNPNFHGRPVLATFTSMTVLPSQSS